jgi:hypothetical protein
MSSLPSRRSASILRSRFHRLQDRLGPHLDLDAGAPTTSRQVATLAVCSLDEDGVQARSGLGDTTSDSLDTETQPMMSNLGVGYEKQPTTRTSSHMTQYIMSVVPWTKAEDDILLRERQKDTPCSRILAMLPNRKSTTALSSRVKVLSNKPRMPEEEIDDHALRSYSRKGVPPWTHIEDSILLEYRRMGMIFDKILPFIPTRKERGSLGSRMQILQRSSTTFVDSHGVTRRASDVR